MMSRGILWQDENLLVSVGEIEKVEAEGLYQFTPHQQCTRVVVYNFHNFTVSWYLIMVLICMSLKNNDIKSFPIYLFTIQASTFFKYPSLLPIFQNIEVFFLIDFYQCLICLDISSISVVVLHFSLTQWIVFSFS